MIPLVELHSHLEGCVPPQLALTIAQRNKIRINPKRLDQKNNTYHYNGFLDFIHTYDEIIAAIIKTPQDYYDIMFYYLKQSAEEGVIYLETLYSPDLAEKSTAIPSIEHLYAIEQAIHDAQHQFGIIGRILIAIIRHFGTDTAEKAAKQAIKDKRPCVVGFNLTGDEINYPPKPFARAFHIAQDAGLKCTAHAGEFADGQSVIQAIQHLPIERIGHGVQAFHSPHALHLIKEKNITLEICPSSNVCLGLYKTLSEHPLPQLIQHGISVCLNTDDPPFFQTTIAQEYKKVQETFHYSDEVMLSFTQQGINAAFADEATKQILRDQLKMTL